MNKYLKQLLDALAKKNAEKQGILTKALDSGQTPNEDEEKQIEGIDAEIATIEKNVARVRDMIAQGEKAATTATPVAGQTPNEAQEAAAGNPNPTEQIIVKSNLPKGVGFAQYAQAKLVSQLNAKEGRFESPLEVAKQMGFGEEVQDLITKATLGTTTNAGFAATLVHENQLVGEFVELLRQATVFDKLQGFRAVPFRSKIPSQVTGGQHLEWMQSPLRFVAQHQMI